MGKKRVMLPADEVDLTAVKYEYQNLQAPHLTGIWVKLFVKLLESPFFGSLILAKIKKDNRMVEMLRNTVIPEAPMFRPEFPPQDKESGVTFVEEDGKPAERVEIALKSLPDYDPSLSWTAGSDASFRYWKIRDYACAYRSKLTTPSIIAERFIEAMEEFSNKKPAAPLLISYDPDDVRKQAAASTQRFEEGNPLSLLDGTFMAIKDDIDCCPHPSNGGTTWFHEVRKVKRDAVSVSRLRSCGVILVGKANMHEFGMGTTGNNPNHGTARNPHDPNRYTGGSSSGPAAIVASGLCSAALGTDGGGSIRIPSSLCGVVGLKSTYGRTDITGALCDSGTVEIIGPITSTAEDSILVYAAILGSSPADKIVLRPSLPCVPSLSSAEGQGTLPSLQLGKYSEWFNDVFASDISAKCEEILHLLSEKHGYKTIEIAIPELPEMQNAHLVSIGSEALASMNPDFEDGNGHKFTCDTRTSLALFRSFTAADYVSAQCLRRRIMSYYTEIFKKVDVIVTPTTGMTAPLIPPSALTYGETDMQVTVNLMRFIAPANLLGLPAISVPVGYDKLGLPIGLQLLGRPWGEATILRLASAIEALFPEPKKKPVQFYDILKGTK